MILGAVFVSLVAKGVESHWDQAWANCRINSSKNVTLLPPEGSGANADEG
jgi:hypothetical protein